jgi:outer membrane lipoprotein-sorting protein
MSSTLQLKTALLLFSFLIFTSCRPQNETVTTHNATPETVVSSTPPFQTKEPDRYSATRTITIATGSGAQVVMRTSIAKDGEKRRTESAGLVYLELPEGRFVLVPDESVYADLSTESKLPNSDDEEQLEISPERLLHTEDGTTSYQNLGPETTGGRSANKYRVVVNSSGAGNVSLSETLIWIDDSLKMPIRSETRSADGSRVIMELSGVTLNVAASLFQVPDDYEKIAFSEFRKRLRAGQPPR